MSNKEFEELLSQLSTEEQEEVRDFAKFLLAKKRKAVNNVDKLQLTWSGGLKTYKDHYTSLELQKKSLDWMGE